MKLIAGNLKNIINKTNKTVKARFSSLNVIMFTIFYYERILNKETKNRNNENNVSISFLLLMVWISHTDLTKIHSNELSYHIISYDEVMHPWQ